MADNESGRFVDKHVRDGRERFLEALVQLCSEHGIGLSHEDGHGAFQVTPYDEFDPDWIRSASFSFNYFEQAGRGQVQLKEEEW